MKIHFSAVTFCSDIKQVSGGAFLNHRDTIFCVWPLLIYVFCNTLGLFFLKMQWGVRSERCHLKSERIRNVNACCRTAELHHPFPSHHPIHYASWTVSSKLKVTLWWAPPSRVWCMCACVCEMDWRALKEGRLLCSCCRIRHTHTHCWDVGQN